MRRHRPLASDPLGYEDEVAILRHVAALPEIDAGSLFHLGVSHAGEMLFKPLSHYPGLLRAGIAAEPANHELLTLGLAADVTDHDGLRDIESLEIRGADAPRSRNTDPAEVTGRLDAVDIPSSSSAATRTSSKASSASPTTSSPTSARTSSGTRRNGP